MADDESRISQAAGEKPIKPIRIKNGDDLSRLIEGLSRDVVDAHIHYGGTRRDAGQAIGKTGDGGIDGIIKEDRLGLDTIYIQAKRYTEQPVSRPDIQAFVGALQGVRARKGIFITTSTFSGPAVDYTTNIDTKVVLIDGRQIAEYMIDFNVGVSTVNAFEVKRLDGDYFNT